MRKAKDCGDAKREFGAPSSPGILLKIQGATHGWKYKKQFGETNVPGKGHGGCDFAAGENVLCATVTRTAGKIMITCDDSFANDRMTGITTGIVIANVKVKQMERMTRDDRENTIPSRDDASLNNGVY